MRSRTQTTVWNLFFHYASIALMVISGLVLVPVYLKFIPLQDYGAWLATGNILVWITAVDPGLSTVLQQRVGFAYGRKDYPEMGRVIVSGAALGFVLSLVPVLLALVLAPYIPGLLKLQATVDTATLLKAFVLAGFGTTLSIFSFSLTAVNQGLLSSVGIGVIYVIVHALDIIVTILLLWRGWGLMAIAFSFVLRGSGMLLGNAGYLLWRVGKEKISLSFSFSGLMALSKVLSFTFFSKAGSLIISNMESFLVARFVGAEHVPILALTKKSLDMSRIAVERPPLAFMPAISHLFGAGEISKVRINLVRLFRILLWTFGLIVGGVFVLNESFVGLWVGNQYFAGELINAVLCFNFVLVAMHTTLSNLALSLGDIKKNSLVSFTQSVLYALLAVLLGRAYGMIGIVTAMSVSILMISAWYYPRSIASLISLSSQDIRALRNEALFVLLVSALGIAVFSHLPSAGIVGFLALVVLFFAAYSSGLWAVSSGFREEMAKLFKLRFTWAPRQAS